MSDYGGNKALMQLSLTRDQTNMSVIDDLKNHCAMGDPVVIKTVKLTILLAKKSKQPMFWCPLNIIMTKIKLKKKGFVSKVH